MSLQERVVQVGLLVALLWNALWVVATPAFPTLDGWTHLHTARMLFDGGTGDLYCATPGLVPNWMGHGVLGVLQLLLPAMVAERIMLALIVLCMGAGTWLLARTQGRTNPLILLVLPFTYNHLLVLGFHNFLLGTGLALMGAAWWTGRSRTRSVHALLLAVIGLLLFLSHTMAIAFFALLVVGHETLAWASGSGERKRTLHSLAGLLPGLVLLAMFQLAQEASWNPVDRQAVLRSLFDLRVLDLYHPPAEEKFNYALKVLTTGVFALSLAWRFFRMAGEQLRPVWHPGRRDLPLLAAGVLLLLSFLLPDSTGYAGYITLRLHLLAFLMMVVWVASLPVPVWATLAPAVAVLLLHNARWGYLGDEARASIPARDSLLEAAQFLPEGAVVLPFSMEDNWLLHNAASLLAVESKVHLLSNYEASNAYFPLRWCPGMPDALKQHLGGTNTCLEWLEPHVAEGRWPVIDHIVVFGREVDSSRCGAAALETTLARHFEPGFTNGYARVFPRKQH